jgi:uncharacterized UBP type Zn finger protein
MPRRLHRRHDSGGPGGCAHGAADGYVEPFATECPPCRQQGTGWVELWLCLSCGWVACSNTSPHQHAKAHYEETDHPVAVPLQDGPLPGGAHPRWCYVHDRPVWPESADSA